MINNKREDQIMNENKVKLYAAAQIINELFAREGIDRTIKPQMLYNYNNKGTLTRRFDVTADDDKKVTIEDVKKIYNGIKNNSRTTSNISALADLIS